MSDKPTSVQTYILSAPEEIQPLLHKIRDIIHNTVPEASESISYGMPAYKLNNKPLIYFAYFKNHIGLYATPDGQKAFTKELAGYKQGKGSVQFPFDQTIPFDLIQQIVEYNKQKILSL